MTAAQPESPVTDGVRSLEVRWIFPGQLETAVAGWFGRFPAGLESREDAYLLFPHLRGLSVKLRAGGALDVKVYRGSPGILDVAGRARGRLSPGRSGPFPSSRSARTAVTPLVGGRSARRGESAGSRRPADGSWRGSRGWRTSRGARWNPPRSARVARPGGHSGSKRPALPACSGANLKPRQRSCSPRHCPVGWNPARMTPGPMRSGSASGRNGLPQRRHDEHIVAVG